MKGLSICIPIYNFNCIDSVKELCIQIQNSTLKAEIIVIDDASTKEFKDLKDFENQFYTYKKLSNNIGRSKIRNLLAEKSKFDFLLFLDGDSGIPKSFIENYISNIKIHLNSIICGGTIYKQPTSKKNSLRYNYGVKYEDIKSSVRDKKPYHSFTTNNFIAPKHVLEKIPFNEKIVKYGHEDTFFGYELNLNNIKIIHIDNPVIHLDVDTNIEYIQKTKHSIENLFLLETKYPKFSEFSKLLTLIKKYRVLRLKPIKGFSNIFSKVFEIISIKTNNAYSFQLFKLFYTISLNK